MQNDADPAPDAPLTPEFFRRTVLALGISAQAADLDAARPAAEVLRRKAREVRAPE